jgi:hypothetical protein
MRSKLDNPEEFSRLVGKQALELYGADQERAQEHSSMAAALTEIDVPPEYLQRAETRIRWEEERRGRRKVVVSALAAVATFGSFNAWLWAHHMRRSAPPSLPAPAAPMMAPIAAGAPAPVALAHRSPPNETLSLTTGAAMPRTVGYSFKPLVLDLAESVEDRWSFSVNPGTQAWVDYKQDDAGRAFASIQVARFLPSAGPDYRGEWWADLKTDNGTKDLLPFQALTFRARAKGLGALRLICNDADYVEWVSAPVAIAGDWETYSIRLDSLNHYANIDGAWRPQSDSAAGPHYVSAVAFQFGQYANTADKHGYIDIGDIVFR